MAMSPFRGRGFYDVQGEMNRMFDEMFGGLARAGGRQQGERPMQWAPALDVLHDGGDVVVRAELPGVKQEDVEVTLHRGVLTLSGKREAEEQREGSGFYVRERRYGTFRRSMALPESVEDDAISARFRDGVLEIRVPGAAAVQEPKRIEIEGADDNGSGDNNGS